MQRLAWVFAGNTCYKAAHLFANFDEVCTMLKVKPFTVFFVQLIAFVKVPCFIVDQLIPKYFHMKVLKGMRGNSVKNVLGLFVGRGLLSKKRICSLWILSFQWWPHFFFIERTWCTEYANKSLKSVCPVNLWENIYQVYPFPWKLQWEWASIQFVYVRLPQIIICSSSSETYNTANIYTVWQMPSDLSKHSEGALSHQIFSR